MRVRPQRQAERRKPAQRRPHVLARPATADAADPELSAERRHRASVVPDDQATYRCGCGAIFAATVSTTVACPHCGSAQAW